MPKIENGWTEQAKECTTLHEVIQGQRKEILQLTALLTHWQETARNFAWERGRMIEVAAVMAQAIREALRHDLPASVDVQLKAAKKIWEEKGGKL